MSPIPPTILQDPLTDVEQGQKKAHVPFSICSDVPYTPGWDYGYKITSKGHVGPAINTTGTVIGVCGGECKDVYGVIDAGDPAEPCDYDTLTIIAWSLDAPVAYDTCVQIIHVVEQLPVPLFSAEVVTILVFALILAAAVVMRKRIINRAERSLVEEDRKRNTC